jgi:membrane-associated phospholipid phosphatase
MNICQNQHSLLNKFFRNIPFNSPIIIFILYYFTKKIELFNLFIGTLIINFISVPLFKQIFSILLDLYSNYIIKDSTNNELPFIGLITRPSGAKNCGCFYIDENNYSTSSGMPSGHSMLIGFICIYIYYFIKNSYKNNINLNYSNHIILILVLILITSYMMYTRVMLGCHTIEQTIMGVLIGGILGYYYYKYFSKC